MNAPQYTADRNYREAQRIKRLARSRQRFTQGITFVLELVTVATIFVGIIVIAYGFSG